MLLQSSATDAGKRLCWRLIIFFAPKLLCFFFFCRLAYSPVRSVCAVWL